MATIRRRNLPPALLRQLIDRVNSRSISVETLALLADWLKNQPEVPEGRWFNRFPGVIVCGENELIKTFLSPDQAATGEQIK